MKVSSSPRQRQGWCQGWRMGLHRLRVVESFPSPLLAMGMHALCWRWFSVADADAKVVLVTM